MKLWVDTANLDEIAEWAAHPWVSGFTTNPTLVRNDSGYGPGFVQDWAKYAVEAAAGKSISIDGPHSVRELGPNVYRKVIHGGGDWGSDDRLNFTAICTEAQTSFHAHPGAIVSVFAGRIMDTGRDPGKVIDAAKRTGANVLWASVREPFNITQAGWAGCQIVTVPPAILRKYLEWNGMPLETVAELTIAQFDKDREGLWT